ncbi:MAG: hypothetical protein R3C44_24480 [Chloroflexota bacterium]
MYLRPVQVLTQNQWLISHLFIWIGLGLVMGHIALLHTDDLREVSMLLGGIWTLAGGICFAVVYIVRQMKKLAKRPADFGRREFH